MFSIIIPYYKKRQYIERCLDSVMNQSFQDFEIILVDDGSEDDLNELIDQNYRGRIKLITQENQGVSVARNTGIANATQEYIAFLDADDSWSPCFLERNAELIGEETEVKIIGSHYSRDYSKIETTKQQLNYYRFTNYFKQAIRNTYFLTSATIINSRFFKDNPGFNPALKRGEDIDVWLRTVASGGNAYYIENTLVYYSDEDINQATASIGNVENSLVGIINNYYQLEIQNNENPNFSTFVSKYVYFNLYPYYFSAENHKRAKLNLKQNKHFYFFLHLPYYIPRKLGEKLISNKKFSRYLRLYLKFCLRNIYS